MGWVWSTHVEIHFLTSLAWDGFGHMFWSVLCSRMHGVRLFNSSWGTFCVIAAMRGVFFNTCWVAFSDLAGLGGVWSTQVEMHFVSVLAWDGFGQHQLSYILFPHWHGIGLVNTSWDPFCVLVGMGVVWSKHVDMHFLSSLAWEESGQHKARYILGPRWHEWCLVNTN